MKLLADFWQDVRFGTRLLRKNRRLTAGVVLTLTVVVGANSLVFSVVHAVLVRQLDYEQPDRLVQLWQSGLGGGGRGDWVSFPNFKDWAAANRTFEDMAAYRFSPMTLSGDGDAESMLGLQVTDRLFSILGVQPAAGRLFERGEDVPGHESVAIISHALWQRRYAGDRGALGRQVTVDGKPYTIIGIMPDAFHFPSGLPGESAFGPIQVDMWIPMLQAPDLAQRGSQNFWVIARLKTSSTIEQARAEMQNIGANLALQYPETNKDLGVVVVSLQDYVTGSVRPALLLLLAAVGVLLLLACGNIANLLLSVAESRRREMALRAAIGAARGRLIRQSLIESGILAFVGAGAGLLIASFGLDIVIRWMPSDIPRIEQTSIDGGVILFTGVAAVVAGLLFGLAPALSGSHRNVYESIKQAASNLTAGRAALGLRHAFVAGQMAIAVMLLIGAGLLIRSFANVMRLDTGFESANLALGIISLPPSRYPNEEQQARFFDEALRRVRALPGVVSVSVSNSVPLMGINDQGGFRIEGRPASGPGQQRPVANRPSVSVDYFDTMGIRLIKGRYFDERDSASVAPVAIVSDLAVEAYWPNQDPIGKRLSMQSVNGQPVWREIVGVVHATRHFGLEARQLPEVYIPYAQSPSAFAVLTVRYRGDADQMIRACRREVGSLDPEQAGFPMTRMDNVVSNSQARRRFQTLLLAAFAALGVFLASTGIYGVTAYNVSRRTREIGLRLALGARPSSVVRMVLASELRILAIGIVAGVIGAVALSKALASFLFGVTPLDRITFALVITVAMLVAVAATYLPGRWAAAIDPAISLREE
jgi:putative ABC transport system permease protein